MTSYIQTALLTSGLLLILGSYLYLAQSNVTLDHGFTSDFTAFVNSGQYAEYKFDRTDITWSTYGGYETRPTTAPARYPIVFVHGNSDIGVGNGGTVGWQTGFTKLIDYLQTNGGYKKQDLYVTTWGPANPNMASQNSHNKANIMFTRKFIEAVLEYTKAEKIYVIGHSMGVTLARQALLGGASKDSIIVNYEIGAALTSRVEAFFGLAGANRGLVDCTYATYLPTCSKVNGFSPASELLDRVNSKPHSESAKVYSYWSPSDDIIKYSCMVKGQNTCIVPSSDKDFSYSGYTHFDVRDKSGVDILPLLLK